MNAQTIIIVAQLALAFGKDAALTFIQLHDRLSRSEPVTKEEVIKWLVALNYAELVPNSLLPSTPVA